MRRLGLAALLAGTLAASGCCVCDAPYDYCYPTFTGTDCGEPCCRTHERVGSIRYGGLLPDSAEYYEMSTPSPTPADVDGQISEPPPPPDSYYDGRASHAPRRAVREVAARGAVRSQYSR
jgi:hypothetical protein